MNERVMNIETFERYFINTFRTHRVRVREDNRVFTIEPAPEEKRSSADRLRGMFKDPDGRAVERFLERKHADKELDL